MSDDQVHILLVEDETNHAELVRRAFEARGGAARLTVAENLAEARAHVATGAKLPHLIIADWRLPDGEGMDLLPETGSPPRVPLVLMTSHGNEQMAVEAIKAGALDYVVKSDETLRDMPHIAERALRDWRTLTERRRAEAALRASEERFRALIQNSSDVITLLSAQGTILYDSPSITSLSGYAPEERLGQDSFAWVHPDDAVSVKQEFSRLFTDPARSVTAQFRFRHKDGSWRWVELTGANLLHLPGVQAMVANYHDITEHKQAEETLRRYAARMEIFHEIDRNILAARSPEEIVAAATSRLRQLVPCWRASVTLFDFRAGQAVMLASSFDGETSSIPVGTHLAIGDMFDAAELATLWQGQPLDVEDLATISELSAVGHQLLAEGVRAVVCLPLLPHGELIGTLNLVALNLGIFSSEHIEIARQVADQLAIALQQSRLSAETAEALAREQRLNEVARVISSAFDLDVVIPAVARLAAELIGAETGTVALLAPDGKSMEEVYSFNLPTPLRRTEPFLKGEGLGWHVVETGASVLIDDYRTHPQAMPYAVEAGVRAYLAAPLVAGETCLGVLKLFTLNPERKFTRRELALAEAVGRQAGVAIQNARLFAETAEALVREQRLNEVARVISGALELDTIIPNVVRLAVELVGAEAGSMAVLASGGEAMTFPYTFNLPALLDSAPAPKGIGLAWRIVETGQPILVADYGSHPDALREWVEAGVKGMMGVPVVAGDVRLGALGLFSLKTGKRFTERDLALAESIGQQAGVTIQNARLFEAEQRRVALLTALHETGLDISVQLDLPLLLQTIVERAARLLNASMGSFFLLQTDGQFLDMVVRHNVPPGEHTAPRLRLGEGAAGRVAQTGEPLIVADYPQWPGHVATLTDVPYRAVLSVPMKWQGQVTGVINVLDERPGRFGLEDADAVGLLAAQAAGAIQNARLFEAEQRRVALLTALHETGLDLSAQLDLPTLLRTIMERAARLLHAPMGGLYLLEPDGQTLRPVANLPPEDVSTPVRLGEGLVGRVAQSGTPMVVADYNQWPGRLSHLQNVPFCAVVSAPITWQAQVLGVISICDPRPERFGPEDIEIVGLFADQAAVAIKNAQFFEAETRLLQETRQRVQELEGLHEIAQAFSALTDVREASGIVVERIARLIGAKQCVVLLRDSEGYLCGQVPGYGLRDELVASLRFAFRGVEPLAEYQEYLERGYRLMNSATEVPPFAREVAQSQGMESALVTPMRVEGSVIGHVVVLNKPGGFGADDVRLLGVFAGQAAIVIMRLRAEVALRQLNAELERRVLERTEALRQRSEELSAANAALAKAARLKDEFLASMSHELRTPLTGILAFAQALQKQIYGPLTEKQLKSLRSIEDSGKLLLELINDILDLSKIEAGQLELAIGLVSAEEVSQASLRLVKQMAHAKRQEVAYSLSPLDLRLLADNRRLKQMLVNLLSNAIKFTPEGGSLGLQVEGDSRQKIVRFTVWDKGIGIAAGDMPKLFRSFVQLDSSLSRRYLGTGLGLALVRRMAEMHGGGVAVESEVGRGSRFTITLPWTLPPGMNQAEARLSAPRPTSSLQRALTVEDAPIVAEQLTQYLRELGLANVVHPQAEGVVEKAAGLQPGVILLDIYLSDYQSGWDVLAQLKADPRTRTTPVVIVSVLEDRARAAALGAAAYMVKPVSLADLQTTLGQVASQSPASAGHPVLLVEPLHAEQPRPRLLLAEDNAVNIAVLSDYLAAEGYDVIVARNGSEAIQQARTVHPHVILMDVQMPEMDGLEAMRRIRQEAGLAATPMIALTALAMPGDRERCLAAGASDYLTKPVNLEQLAQTIQSHL